MSAVAVRKFHTVAAIALRLNLPRHRVDWIIRSRGIAPVAVIGETPGYSDEAISAVNEHAAKITKARAEGVATDPADSLRVCRGCHDELDTKHFRRSKHGPGGFQNYCRKCRKERQNKITGDAYYLRMAQQKYNITPAEYQAMHDAQGGVCAICKNPERARHQTRGRPKRLAIDHDHQTGTVRGLLCSGCNLVLGFANDSHETLVLAAEYLKSRTATVKHLDSVDGASAAP